MEAPMDSNHPITKLETAINHILGNCPLDEHVCVYHDLPGTRDSIERDNAQTAALTALCREYAASELERILGPGPVPTNIPAIAQTDDYANGWNDCRKEAHNQLQNYRNELRRTLRVRADELEGK